MDALVELRQRLKGDPALEQAKLTYMPFFLKVCSRAGAGQPAWHMLHQLQSFMDVSGDLAAPAALKCHDH
jgi:hypothetical protein